MNAAGDDVCDGLEIGSHFSLWNGDDAGQGIGTRRLPNLLRTSRPFPGRR